MEPVNAKPPRCMFTLTETDETKMAIRLEPKAETAASRHRNKQMKTPRTGGHSIPRWGYILFAALAIFAVARGLQRRVESAKAGQPPARPVLVTKVITKDVPLYIDEIGTCAAYETVQVQAQASGQIIARHFQDGSDVKQGDLLFSIDPKPYQAALDQAQGQLAQTKAQLAIDQLTLKRQQDLRARNVISQQDLDVAQATVNSDEAKVKSAEGAVAAAQVNLDYCSIRSPINGRAGLRLVDVGNVVTGNTSGTGAVLLTIQGLDPIYTDFTVAENDLPLVRKYLGAPNVKVQTVLPDASIPPRIGDLYFIDNAVQPGSGTVKARAVTPNPDRALWPSEFVRVRFILDTLKDVPLVPSQAVQISQSGPFVFVVKPDNTVDLRSVKPGQRQDGDLTVIESGVKAGETVVVTGQLALSPGAKVDPKPYAPPNAANAQHASAKGTM
jgi:multidrug efflux system membrane fusion protein